jgi:RNA polymerase sigma factor for flagellar operon FliA
LNRLIRTGHGVAAAPPPEPSPAIGNGALRRTPPPTRTVTPLSAKGWNMTLVSKPLAVHDQAARVPDADLPDLWRRYRDTQSENLHNTLLEHYLPLVKYQADRATARLPSEVDPDDVYAAGILGLYEAVGSFDPERGVKFETYGAARIRGAIIDMLRQSDWVPRSVRRHHRCLEHARAVLESELGRPASDADMARFLDMDDAEYNRFARRAEPVRVASLDAAVPSAAEGHDAPWADLVAEAHGDRPDRRALSEDLKQMLAQRLSRQERIVLVLYYWEEMTMKEIAATLDLSETRICQIHSALMERLRESLQGRAEEFHVA